MSNPREDMDSSGFVVRAGKREDAGQAARLWMQSASDHASYDSVYETSRQAEKMMRDFLADLSSMNHSFLFVAETTDSTDGIVGFISGELREGSPTFSPKSWASVDDVYVEPEYRSAGIGRALLASVREWAASRNCTGISLQVAAANDRGRKFYQDLGFREVSIYEVLEF